jgi:hypothetical protein
MVAVSTQEQSIDRQKENAEKAFSILIKELPSANGTGHISNRSTSRKSHLKPNGLDPN